jgi:hypothetical protein
MHKNLVQDQVVVKIFNAQRGRVNAPARCRKSDGGELSIFDVGASIRCRGIVCLQALLPRYVAHYREVSSALLGLFLQHFHLRP